MTPSRRRALAQAGLDEMASGGSAHDWDRPVKSTPRLAVLTDFPEEGWLSMDLCGDELLAHLPRGGPRALEVARVCPPFRRLASRTPGVRRSQGALNADRVLNRFVHFPRHVRHLAGGFDLFHIVDHSYAHLAHVLPRGRVGVFCHDLDAFRSLLEPTRAPRPRWYRALARRILVGMQNAAIVFHGSETIGQQIKRAALVDPGRLVHSPYGLDCEFVAESPRPPVHVPWFAELEGRPWLLHVGSCIPRKRIDVLLEVLAELRRNLPQLRLVKVGGEWRDEHRNQIRRSDLADAIVHVVGLDRLVLAEVYRRAPVVLIPSEAEGFGLPVLEALGCGAPVVASDIPAIREAGGPAAVYAPVGDIGAWADAVMRVLIDPASGPSRDVRLAWARQFSWAAHAETIARAYHRLL